MQLDSGQLNREANPSGAVALAAVGKIRSWKYKAAGSRCPKAIGIRDYYHGELFGSQR